MLTDTVHDGGCSQHDGLVLLYVGHQPIDLLHGRDTFDNFQQGIASTTVKDVIIIWMQQVEPKVRHYGLHQHIAGSFRSENDTIEHRVVVEACWRKMCDLESAATPPVDYFFRALRLGCSLQLFDNRRILGFWIFRD